MTDLNDQARQVLDMIAASGLPPLDEMPADQARIAAAAAFAQLSTPKGDDVVARNLTAAGPAGTLTLRLYRPADVPDVSDGVLPVLIYFHGGGWVICDLDTHDVVCRRLCAASGCAVVSVDYRLAPEHKFPAAVEDAYAAVEWVATNAEALGINPKRIAVGGDSAGGNLAAVVSLMARDRGGPAIVHQLLLYPVTQMGAETDSYTRNGDGYFLTRPLMQWFFNHYLRSEADAADWRASPLNAERHDGLPPATIVVCGFDPLLDDGVRYAEALKAAGVESELVRYDRQIHGFLNMDAVIPEAAECLQRMGSTLKRALK